MAKRRKSADSDEPLDIMLCCKEIVADYLDNAFPTRAMESYWDEDSNERSRPMVDEAGNPVHSQEALRIKAETLELLGALPPTRLFMPVNSAREIVETLAA